MRQQKITQIKLILSDDSYIKIDFRGTFNEAFKRYHNCWFTTFDYGKKDYLNVVKIKQI